MRKILSLMLVLCLCFSLFACGAKTEEPVAEPAAAKDIVILHTNDIHTYIDGPLSYNVLAGLKAGLSEQYDVILVDAGDAIQGTAYGSMDKGMTIIELMNAAGYDLATLGNHEFDYGMDGCMAAIEAASFDYISSNFHHEENGVAGENVLESSKVFTFGDTSVAFVGITTPETFTKSTPAYFQNEQGAYIYGIASGDDGSELYAAVQTAIDEVSEEADYVIALGHLGVDLASQPWTSLETIAATSGLDAFIDGHSHTTIDGEMVADKDGNEVVLVQTGEYFDAIGLMHIDAETGAISTDLISYSEILEPVLDENGNTVVNDDGEEETEVVGYKFESELLGTLGFTGEWASDDAVNAIKTAWMDEIETVLGEVIGTTDVVFDNYDAEGKRLVRSQETNTGDFAADALYYLFDDMGLDVDVAIMNGGGVRNKTLTGDISYLTAKEIHTFGNVACLQTITGQQLLDALEWGARGVGSGEEIGGFLHVSGVTYCIDTQWPDTTQKDDKDVWIGQPTGGYRVHDVKVYNKETGAYEALDLEAKYNLAGYNYTLRDLGDGFNMFDGAVNVLDYVMEDYMVLANYIEGFENGVVGATNSPLLATYPGMLLDYSDVNGSGRITIE